MHRCVRFPRSTRGVYVRNVAYSFNAPPRARLQSRFSSSSSEPSASSEPAPPPPRKSTKTTALLLSALALAAAATAYQLSSSSPPASSLHHRTFTPYTITSKTPISPTSTIFTLSPPPSPTPPSDDPYAPLWPSIWSLTFRQPQLQVARSYTPLPPLTSTSNLPSSAPGSLRFLIRRELGGEVSTYLSHLPTGATIDVRGPVVEYAIPPDVSEVVFLAGGTGIAPAMQAVRAVLGEGGEDQDKTVKILWANRRRDECAGAPVSTPWYAPLRFWGGAPSGGEEPPSPLVEELRGLEARYGGQVEVRYFIDAEGSFIDRKGILDAVREGEKVKEGKKMIMVAGPEGFVKHYVGARVWEGGEEKQGPLGGVVKGLGLAGWEVVKL